MTLPTLKLDYYGDPAAFYCPVCGTGLYSMDADGPCEHVVFYTDDCSGEWTWNNSVYEKDFLKVAQNTMEDGDELYPTLDEYLDDFFVGDLAQMVSESIDSDSAFLFSVCTNGIACGPVSSAYYVIVDFKPPTEENN